MVESGAAVLDQLRGESFRVTWCAEILVNVKGLHPALAVWVVIAGPGRVLGISYPAV